jgi:hypothetical protein
MPEDRATSAFLLRAAKASVVPPVERQGREPVVIVGVATLVPAIEIVLNPIPLAKTTSEGALN